MNKFSFKKSVKNKTKDTLLSIVVIIASSLMLLKSYNDDSKIALIFFLLLLIGGTVMLFKAISNKTSVVVNKEGIHNNTNGMGLIQWKFITRFQISKIRNTQVLIIKINDSQEFLSQVNSISRKLMKSSINKLGSPVVIMQNEIDQALTLVKAKLEDYRASLLQLSKPYSS